MSLKAALAAAVLALAACAPTADAPASAPAPGWRLDAGGDLNGFFDCLSDQGIALVAAHRGGPAPGYPENAVETFAHMLTLAPALFEIDLTGAADGVLYLMHDDTLARTTTGEGRADAISYDEASKLRLEDARGDATDFAPPRFDDALQWADGKTILIVDFKPSARYEDAAAIINDQRAEDRVILIAYTLAQAEKLHRLMPRVMISLNIDSVSDLNRAVAAGVPADRLIAFTGEADARLFSGLGGQGVEIDFGALLGDPSVDRDAARSGDNAPYASLAAKGADIVTTDRPAAANAALAADGRAARDGVCGVSKS